MRSDETGDTLYSAHPSLTQDMYRGTITLALLRWIGHLEQFSQITNQQDKDERMSIDLTQQALNALADAGLGNDTPAEAYVIGYTQGHNDALALAIRIEQAITATPLTPDELDLLALALWEANGERPTVYESGKAVADDVLEWWKQVAASAWGFINGTEAMQ